jgi:hypothetical protein
MSMARVSDRVVQELRCTVHPRLGKPVVGVLKLLVSGS